MYTWNSIKINIDGNKKRFISDMRKYLHASYSESADMDYAIGISVYDANENMLPPVSRGAKLKK